MGRTRHAGCDAWKLLGSVYLLVLLFASPAAAQFGFSSEYELSGAVQVREIDGEAKAHLERIKAFLADEQWDEAVETLRQVMENQGDRVIAVESNRYLTIRDYCHQQLANLPPEALKLYRDRVDPLARKWYDDGVAQRDPAKLRQVVDQLFCSSWGDDALLKLGDLALERGDYGAARGYFEQINPLLRRENGRPLWLPWRSAMDLTQRVELKIDLDAEWAKLKPAFTFREHPPLWLGYPGTNLDLADLRARLVLVSILEGNRRRAETELDLFRRLHPDATGNWGGREIAYAEELAKLLQESATWPTPPPARRWTTFAGSPQRTTEIPPVVRLAGQAWEEPIELDGPVVADGMMAQNFGYGGRRPAEDVEQLLSYHPLVVDDLLLVNDLQRVKAFNLKTGKPAWGQAEGVIFSGEDPGFNINRHNRSRLGVPRFTMSACDGKLFARLGEPVTSWPPDPPHTTEQGYLVCLDLEAQGQLLWKISANAGENANAGEMWAFEGSPLCDGANVYVAMRRSDVRPQAYVACFDAQTGRQRWRRYVCAAETPARGQVDEITTNLLTLAEGTLYYNTNLGAVAALSAADGQVRWISLYKRTETGDLAKPGNHFYRDLTPCVYYRGVVIVAPSDSEQITALDAATGQLLWATDKPSDAVHLLGVSSGYLIATGNRVWWINVENGKVLDPWPESKVGGPQGYGRGLLAGKEIYWPTRDRIYVLDAATRHQTQEPILLSRYDATGGNLLAIDGYLLIAGAERIYGFHQLPSRREAPQPEVTARPPGLLDSRRSTRPALASLRPESLVAQNVPFDQLALDPFWRRAMNSWPSPSD